MKKAFYLRFSPVGPRLLDRTGGVPTHLPPAIPRCSVTDQEMAFLAQFYCHPERLPVAGILCIQLYQCQGVDEGDPPDVTAVAVPLGAIENTGHIGIRAPNVAELNIEWEEVLDPDEVPVSQPQDGSNLPLYKAKSGGALVFSEQFPLGFRGLLQLTPQPAGFNFGGLMLFVLEDERGKICTKLL